MRVLVVDDHDGFRHALVTTLELLNGIEVAGQASDGREACKLAHDLQPDVIVMDLSMPGMSGVEAMREIHRRRPEIPVVILTAYADSALETEALAAGAAGFVPKGGGLQQLVDRLLEAVDVRPSDLAGGA